MSGRVYLMYHELELPGRKLCEGFTGHERYAIPQSNFRRQILQLKNRNWRGMSVSEALADSKPTLPGVVITFDDGSETDLIGAAPLLKEANFSATFYVIVGWLGKPGYLSLSQLRKLSDLNFEIGCHSMTHATLSELSSGQLSMEIADAKQKLEDLLGKQVAHFSAPGGFWSREVAQIAMDAGYCSVSTSRPGVNLRTSDPFHLSRVVVMRNTSLSDFQGLCTGKWLLVRKARETALQVPKRLLGYSKYVKLHSLFSPRIAIEKSLRPSAGVPGLVSMPDKPEIPVHSALIIDYNVGDGGSAYEVMVAESLASSFHLFRHTLDFRKWGALKYLAAPLEFVGVHRILKRCGEHLVAVKTLSAGFLNPAGQPPSIVILHHVGASRNALYSVLEGYIVQQIRKASAIVVVSEYWKRYLLEKGFKNVHKIYNAFRMEEFGLRSQEVEDFKKRYDLVAKPIIYIGNYGRDKGVDQTFDVLKDLDVHLVASGHAGPGCRMKCFFFGRKDYLRLLAASNLAITMSQFAEGWCRAAHEAMLSGTPVIGSGLGGMRELLESGGQIVCHDFGSLRGLVEGLLADEDRRVELALRGREFAKQFTVGRFQAEWVDLVNRMRTAKSEVPIPDRTPGRLGAIGDRNVACSTSSEKP